MSDNITTYEVGGVVIVSKPSRAITRSRRSRRNNMTAMTDDTDNIDEDTVESQETQANNDSPNSTGRRPRSDSQKLLVPPTSKKTYSLSPNSNSIHIGEYNYEYKDHTADIQIHSWGTTLEKAFESVGVGMYGYMFELHTVHVDDVCTEIMTVSAPDITKLCYVYLDELLAKFTIEQTVICGIKVHELTYNEMAQEERKWTIRFTIFGETFSSEHEIGTEVKAITYSHMIIKTHDPTRLNGVTSISIDESNNKNNTLAAVANNEGLANSVTSEEIFNNDDPNALHGSDIYVIVDI